MALYRVERTCETVVVASSEQSAKQVAADAFKEDPQPTHWIATRIEQVSHLPMGWTPNCVPYGGDDDTTIAGHLKKK